MSRIGVPWLSEVMVAAAVAATVAEMTPATTLVVE